MRTCIWCHMTRTPCSWNPSNTCGTSLMKSCNRTPPESARVLNGRVDLRASQPRSSRQSNTLLIAGVITVFHLLFDSMAGYAFAKRQFPGRNVLFWLVLSTLTVPAQVTLIPVFLLLKNLNLLDTYPGIILPGFADVFGVFLMKQYIQTLPSELESAGRVDGASEWQIYQHIILPLCTPALAVLAIFTFQRYWNSFILPLVVLHDSFKYPIQVGLATLQGEFNTDYGMLMTGAAVAAIPMMLVFFTFQRYFVEGIRIGGVKG